MEEQENSENVIEEIVISEETQIIDPENKELIDEVAVAIESIEKPRNNDRSTKIIFISSVIGILICLGIIGYIQIPKIIAASKDRYGFDYNFNKIRSRDWDTLLTERKIAKALNLSPKDINTMKNPDYSWVLEDPQNLVDNVICASLIEEKILDEANDKKSLINATVMLCKNKAEAEKLYSSRYDGTKTAADQDKSITINKLENISNLGTKGYTYSISKVGAPEKDGETPPAPGQDFSGIVFMRGPFMVMLEESAQENYTSMSDESVKKDLGKYIDKEIARSLSIF